MEQEEFRKKLGEVLAAVFEKVIKKNIGYAKGKGPEPHCSEVAEMSGVVPEQVLTTRINEKMLRFRDILLGEGQDLVGEDLYETVTDVCGLAANLAVLVSLGMEQEEPKEETSPTTFATWFKNLFSIKQ